MVPFFLVLTCLMLLVIFFDATRYVIPNWLVGMVAVMWPAAMYRTPEQGVDLVMPLVVMAGMFIVGYGMYAMRWMGGGDIKLLTACSLWTGALALTQLIFMTALFGGGLAIALLAMRAVLAHGMRKISQDQLPRILQTGQPLPYGIAIAVAMLILLWQEKLPGMILV